MPCSRQEVTCRNRLPFLVFSYALGLSTTFTSFLALLSTGGSYFLAHNVTSRLRVQSIGDPDQRATWSTCECAECVSASRLKLIGRVAPLAALRNANPRSGKRGGLATHSRKTPRCALETHYGTLRSRLTVHALSRLSTALIRHGRTLQGHLPAV